MKNKKEVKLKALIALSVRSCLYLDFKSLSYCSRSTGCLAARTILCQYHSVAPQIPGALSVFMLSHTLVKPPFWWMA